MSFVRNYALRGFFDGNCECGGGSGLALCMISSSMIMYGTMPLFRHI